VPKEIENLIKYLKHRSCPQEKEKKLVKDDGKEEYANEKEHWIYV
jgi:hypothetical protein